MGRILLVGILALAAIFALATAFVLVAPYVAALVVIGWFAKNLLSKEEEVPPSQRTIEGNAVEKRTNPPE